MSLSYMYKVPCSSVGMCLVACSLERTRPLPMIHGKVLVLSVAWKLFLFFLLHFSLVPDGRVKSVLVGRVLDHLSAAVGHLDPVLAADVLALAGLGAAVAKRVIGARYLENWARTTHVLCSGSCGHQLVKNVCYAPHTRSRT